jgi:hypothetical protein
MKKGEKLKSPRIYHGLTKSRIRSIWRHMIRRCTQPRHPSYQDYGARGIKVCDRWLDLRNFYADMGHPPEGLSIERIDNNGNYEPGNCRWATQREQTHNTRRNRVLEFNGRKRLLSEWAAEFGMNQATLHGRLKRGLTVQDALTKPVGRWA